MKKIWYKITPFLLCFLFSACSDDADSTSLMVSSDVTGIPQISNISPLSAAAGEEVVINGAYFEEVTENISVLFGTELTELVSASSTSLTVKVPVLSEGASKIFKPRVTVDNKSEINEVDIKFGTSREEFTVNTEVTLNNEELTFNLNMLSTQELEAYTNAIGYPIVWESSNETIAIVNEEGEVTPLAIGITYITASAAGEIATCKVTVTQ